MQILIIMTMIVLMISFIVMMLTNFLPKKMLKIEKKDLLLNVDLIQLDLPVYHFLHVFFLIAIIFLIFDVEIALILPMTIIPFSSNMMIWIITSMMFLLILTIGLYHEWKQGSLKWAS